MLVSTLVGLYGWFAHDLPAKQESTYSQKTVEGKIPLSNIQTASWWAFIWIVVGGFLSFGFFWDIPMWPEKAVMIPSIGFIAGGFTYSVLKFLALAKVTAVLSTTTMYYAVGGWMLLGLAAGYYRGERGVW